MDKIDKKIWDMLDVLPEIEAGPDFENKLFRKIEELEARKETLIEKISKLFFIPVPAAAVIGLLLGIIVGSISIKKEIKEPSIVSNLEIFSSFPQNLITHSYITLTKEEKKNDY